MICTVTELLIERLHLIPDDLIERRQWIVWRNEKPFRPGEKPRKMPYDAMHPTINARVNDPLTWASFQSAVDTFVDALDTPRQFTGIGYVFTSDDPYIGVDLDKCVNGDVIHPEAVAIIKAVGGYAELSPSLTGVKCWTRGKLDLKSTGRKMPAPWGGHIEVYHRERYFTVTGLEVTL